MMSLSLRDAGRLIDMRIGEPVMLYLPENASTGYCWALDEDSDGAIDARIVEGGEAPAAVGSGTVAAFELTAGRAGRHRLRLKHWRQWEGAPSIFERFELEINVAP